MKSLYKLFRPVNFTFLILCLFGSIKSYIFNFQYNRVRPFVIGVQPLTINRANEQSNICWSYGYWGIKSTFIFDQLTGVTQYAYFWLFASCHRHKYKLFSCSVFPRFACRDKGINSISVFGFCKPDIIFFCNFPPIVISLPIIVYENGWINFFVFANCWTIRINAIIKFLFKVTSKMLFLQTGNFPFC